VPRILRGIVGSAGEIITVKGKADHEASEGNAKSGAIYVRKPVEIHGTSATITMPMNSATM